MFLILHLAKFFKTEYDVINVEHKKLMHLISFFKMCMIYYSISLICIKQKMLKFVKISGGLYDRKQLQVLHFT